MEDSKKYDLEERTEKFSLRVRDFCFLNKKTTINLEYIKERLLLHKEAEELTLIFATVLRKLENKGN